MNALSNLGLTKMESATYLALQELGEAKTGAICKKLKIPNSHIYPALSTLMEKGLVSFKYANKIKIFKPSSPDTLHHLFEKKQKDLQAQEVNLQTLIANLKKLPKNTETNSDYQYFEGIAAVKNMIIEGYSSAQRNSEMLLLSAKSESWERMNAFFLEIHKLRVKRNVSLKMILQRQSTNLQNIIEERKEIGLVEIRVADLKINAELLITSDYVFLLDTNTETPCGFMIRSEIFISLFREIHGFIWQNSY